MRTRARLHKHSEVRSAGRLGMGPPRPTSWLTGSHPSRPIPAKVSVCDGGGRRTAETAGREEAEGSEVVPVPTVAEGACLCSLSPHQHTDGV